VLRLGKFDPNENTFGAVAEDLKKPAFSVSIASYRDVS
jgi:hypothetical protein